MTEWLWKTATISRDIAEEIAETCDVPLYVARWLCARGHSVETAQVWVAPTASVLPGSVFTQLERAVDLLLGAIGARHRIAIVGDYDVDGVTATAIVHAALVALDADVVCIIPHRIHDGYGLSVGIVQRVVEADCQVLVTVDNGIGAHEAVAYAVEAGLTVIVTDHHAPSDPLPIAHATVHYARATSAAAALLSGAGVAWKLATRLLQRSSQKLARARARTLYDWITGLAALGTLADMMTLTGENRHIVRAGLLGLERTEEPGWLALKRLGGLGAVPLTETAVLWQITPRLNAAGRMDTALIALQLLQAADMDTANQLAAALEACNLLRKEETSRANDEALEACEKMFVTGGVPAGVVAAGAWPLGVVGIVAAKLVERFGRPAIVFADDGADLLKGSGRAPEGYPLHDIVADASHALHHFGGHVAAIGCAVNREAIAEFTKAFQESAAALGGVVLNDSKNYITADDYLPLGQLCEETVGWMNRLGPFGPGNPPLNFLVGPVVLYDTSKLTAGKHARLTIGEGNRTEQAIWFQCPTQVFDWRPGQSVLLNISLEMNVWQGKTRVQARVIDGASLNQPLSREDFSIVYKLLRQHGQLSVSEILSRTNLSAAHLELICAIFVELGFARQMDSAYHKVDGISPRDLRESATYHRHLINARDL